MICSRCGHEDQRHCKSGVWHTSAKEDSRMLAIRDRKGDIRCTTRHCLEPLCSCVDLIPPASQECAA